MAGGLAAALAGLAHLDSRKHGQQGGGCHSEWTDTVTVHAEGVREACWLALANLGPTGKMASGANGRAAPPDWRSKSCPRHPRLWKFTFRASTEWSGALARRARSRRSRSLGLAVEAVILF
jgi:hypothetical protein